MASPCPVPVPAALAAAKPPVPAAGSSPGSPRGLLGVSLMLIINTAVSVIPCRES